MSRNVALVTTLIFLCSSSMGFADSSGYPVEVISKLGRGISNVVSSPTEISVNMYKQARQAEEGDGNGSGIGVAYFTGLFVGIGFMVARIGVGVADILSFPVPTRPMMNPPTPDGLIETIEKDGDGIEGVGSRQDGRVAPGKGFPGATGSSSRPS